MHSSSWILALVLAVMLAAPAIGVDAPAAHTFTPAPTALSAVAPVTTSAMLPEMLSPLERLVPAAPGTEENLTLTYPAIPIPPGENQNRVLADLLPFPGFIVDFQVFIKDAQTGQPPDHMAMHLHHAHWLRPTADPARASYSGLEWLFGTGEEATRGDFNARSDVEPGGPRYGIGLHGGDPTVLEFMIHNFVDQTFLITMEVHLRVVHGTAATIKAAPDCGPAPPAGATCMAGREFREVRGWIWGKTFDVERDPTATKPLVYPPDEPRGLYFTAPWDATVFGMAGHLHPNAEQIVIANLGPEGSGCEADLDHDGFAGITMFHSRKVDVEPRAWPHGMDFRMEGTQATYRAPVHLGDRIAQYAVYQHMDYASYDAMSYVGLYADIEQAPPARSGSSCTLADTGPKLLAPDGGDATKGILTYEAEENEHAHMDMAAQYCGPSFAQPCDKPDAQDPDGPVVDAISIRSFKFSQGDRSAEGSAAAIPHVAEGKSLTFQNDDALLRIRHAITSCAWPCNGPIMMNYPMPDGAFHSPRLGSTDPIDGAPNGETPITWTTPSDLAPGRYAYFCRLHTWMRGAFIVDGTPLEAASNPPADVQPNSTPNNTPGLEPLALVFAAAVAAGLARRRPS